MKPDYRISFAIASLIMAASLFFPPWKNSITEQFAGFHYVFSDASLVMMLEVDYAKLVTIILAIILMAISAHLLLNILFLNALRLKPLINNLQYSAKKAELSAKKKTDAITDNYIIIKAIIILLIGLIVVVHNN